MKDFREVLYESVLYSFGKILSEYNAFAQESVLRDVGKEILEYLKLNGFSFEERNSLDDVERVIDLFTKNGFSDLEITDADIGSNYKWTNLYGIKAYDELSKVTDNPFISCPLNACIYYISSKYGKTLKLHSKSFDVSLNEAFSQEELVDIEVLKAGSKGFNPLVIENRRLLEIADKKNEELTKALKEVKKLQGLLPICANCKKIRDEEGLWKQIESYISDHSEARFSHGICGDCAEDLYGKEPWFKKAKK